MEGYIFDAVKYNPADDYIKTKREIKAYIGREFKDGFECKMSLELMEVYVIKKPTPPKRYDSDGNEDPKGKMDELEKEEWQMDLKAFKDKEKLLSSNLKKHMSLCGVNAVIP